MAWDVAVPTLYGNLGNSTGWLGYSWDQKPAQLTHTIGYPSNITSGYFTYICVAESFSKSGGVLGMGCDMTYGSSGSLWIIKFIPYQGDYPYSVSGNYVNAVVFGGVAGKPTLYGPQFTNKNFLPLCSHEGC